MIAITRAHPARRMIPIRATSEQRNIRSPIAPKSTEPMTTSEVLVRSVRTSA
jgi:hypothetical protein